MFLFLLYLPSSHINLLATNSTVILEITSKTFAIKIDLQMSNYAFFKETLTFDLDNNVSEIIYSTTRKFDLHIN
jgi:hypothetical protein